MLGKTHRAFALASTATTLGIVGPHMSQYSNGDMMHTIPNIAITLGVSYITASLPDLDRYIPFVRHRGITHAIWIPLIVGYSLFTIAIPPMLFSAIFGVLLSYCFHLFGDAFSKAGIAWFYPLQQYQGEPGHGSFYVKGPRGPFIPLYTVGEKLIIKATTFWYGMSIPALLFMINQIMK